MSEQPTKLQGSDSPGAGVEDEDVFGAVDEAVDEKLRLEKDKNAKIAEKKASEESEEPKIERKYQRWQFINFFKIVILPGKRERVDGDWHTLIPRVSLRPQAHKNGIIDLDNIKNDDINCDCSLEDLIHNEHWMKLIVRKLAHIGVKMLTEEHDRIAILRDKARAKLEKELADIDAVSTDLDAAQEEKRQEVLKKLDDKS